MKVSDFSFELPEELIAQYPAEKRSNDRLLVINRLTGKWEDKLFKDFIDFLKKGDVLVLNNTRVRKARCFAKTQGGGKVEVLFLKEIERGRWSVIMNHSKRRKEGEVLLFEDGIEATIVESGEGTKVILFDTPIQEEFFEKNGHVPLPPYIKREDEFKDETRYQTVYSSKIGSCASPTSGLHFTSEILEAIKNKGVEICYITLHVGMGTFLPMRTETLEEHKMHKEYFEISEDTALKINTAKKEKRNVIASGTTVMRTLESMWDSKNECLKEGSGETDIFIYPGFKFNVVDKLLTNFHTPESTLFALVCAFSSMDIAKAAYKHAVEERYRFFSYGDATFFDR